MIERVHIIEEFNMTIGHMVTVKDDHSFHVGQVIESENKRYIIAGIHPHHDPDAGIVALRVEEQK